VSASNPFTPPNREPNRVPAQKRSWRRPLRIVVGVGIIASALVLFSEFFVMLGYNVYKFTVQIESVNGELPHRVCLLSAHNFELSNDLSRYPEPWDNLVDRRLGYGFAYDERFRGEPILFEVQGTSEETYLRYTRIFHKRFVVLAEWPDGTKTAQIETLPDNPNSKTVRVRLVR
jgi:hypothetical protein